MLRFTNDDRNLLRWKVNFCLVHYALGIAFARKILLSATHPQIRPQHTRVFSRGLRETGVNCGGRTGARRAAHWLLIHWVCGSGCWVPLSLPEWVVGSDGPETHAYMGIDAQVIVLARTRDDTRSLATIWAACDIRFVILNLCTTDIHIHYVW